MEIRNALYAGSFYPHNKTDLKKMILSFLKKTSLPKNIDYAKIKAVIVPHAGYIFSGEVAAYTYKALKLTVPKKIILVGPSHHEFFEGAYTFEGKWKTPLGEIKINSAKLPKVKEDVEHSLEVQVPFLQTILKKFILTPIIYGKLEMNNLAKKLEKEKGVIIISSDLSHYLSYELAKKEDTETINSIIKLDEEMLDKSGDACGKIGIGALIILAKKNKWVPTILCYKNSGDTYGDKERVVGYVSIIFTEH
jgi:MEMO1 family protein